MVILPLASATSLLPVPCARVQKLPILPDSIHDSKRTKESHRINKRSKRELGMVVRGLRLSYRFDGLELS